MKPVYTIDDLASRDLLDAGADKPARLAVLGWPVTHSASPGMHQPALDAEKIDARYIRLEVEPGKIPEAFERMRALGFIGCNVTVPHKLAAMENCTAVDPAARAMGAVNTVRFETDAIRGFNTDGPGFERAIADDFGASLRSLKTTIIGAGGGAGHGLATQCVRCGTPRLVLANRTHDKLAPMVEKLRALGSDTEIVPLALDDPELTERCLESDLIVNTSSVGLKTGDPSVLTADCLRPGLLVYDTIYQPAVTPLLALAASRGCRTANGLTMLLHQGALAFQHWFPGTDPLAVMRTALAIPPSRIS
ncbi:MAG TPA: shikimate dehydrogenase [Luteolibacter sp.]|nr:shikimate dehydrogenase [Luteolibacter sp.]